MNFRFHDVPRKASAREPEVVTIGFLAGEREPRGGYRLPSITANDRPGSRSISDMSLPGVSIRRRRGYLSVATGGRLSSRLVVNKDSNGVGGGHPRAARFKFGESRIFTAADKQIFSRFPLLSLSSVGETEMEFNVQIERPSLAECGPRYNVIR